MHTASATGHTFHRTPGQLGSHSRLSFCLVEVPRRPPAPSHHSRSRSRSRRHLLDNRGPRAKFLIPVQTRLGSLHKQLVVPERGLAVVPYR